MRQPAVARLIRVLWLTVGGQPVVKSAYSPFRVRSAADGGPRPQVGQQISSIVDGFWVWTNVFAKFSQRSGSKARFFRISGFDQSSPGETRSRLVIYLQPHAKQRFILFLTHCDTVSKAVSVTALRARTAQGPRFQLTIQQTSFTMATRAHVLIDLNQFTPR